ncbi:MAG: hypothetical protein LBE91_02760 [Tannerella sp.]|jgi:hypothetical protein|nr:hypothetical protein [Tannerella sp.]
MKYKLLIFIAISNLQFLSGQKKLFDNILNKVERNVDKNYYTDSISAVRHSEYIVNDSTKEFEKAVYIEYFPTPIWSVDGKFYDQRFGYNNSIFPIRTVGYLITAKLYKKDESSNLGFTFPHRFGTSYLRIDIDDFNSSLSNFVYGNKRKRAEPRKNNDTSLSNKINTHSFDTNDNFGKRKPISIEYGINDEKTGNSSAVPTNNLPEKITMTSAPIYTYVRGSDSLEYIVKETVYDETDCYQLTKISKSRAVYTDFERQRFENELINGGEYSYSNLFKGEFMSEQKKNELRQLVEYWANGETVFSETYIVTKKNFAVLSFLREIKQQNYKGEWIEIERIMEKFKEGGDKKYYQTFYTKFIRNYNGDSPNIDHLLTLIVRTPIDRVLSLDSTKVIPRKVYLSYEDFCERVDTLDDNMLLDWNQYNMPQ